MRFAALAFACFVVGCSGAGPYGYSRTYSPLGEEEQALANSREFDPVMAQRVPDEWKKARVNFFGVVKSRKDAPGGGAYLTLGMRTLGTRNLCDEADEDTCRVTVSAREHASVHAVVRLRSGDDLGKLSVQPGSLLRLVGQLGDDVDPADGGPVLRAEFYRHWPRGEFVTMADSEHMRR